MHFQTWCVSLKLWIPFWERVLLWDLVAFVYFQDWGAEDKDEPVSRRQFNKRGLESRREAFCNGRSAWTVLSVCKFSASVPLKTKKWKFCHSQTWGFCVFFRVCTLQLHILCNSKKQHVNASILATLLYVAVWRVQASFIFLKEDLWAENFFLTCSIKCTVQK